MLSSIESLRNGIPLDPLPSVPARDSSVSHAPNHYPVLRAAERKLAVANALRYFPASTHAILAPEFSQELKDYGHIYMYRFRPTHYEMKAYPVDAYPAQSKQAACIMLMIMNNLDPRVAQFPHELVTYGGNGAVFQNWAQYHLVMYYLSRMTEEQTLVMQSGHPLGLFPSSKDAPRVVITNGMVIPNYSSREDYERMHALGVSMYGQMTAGSYCYIGPQGIVHGTTLTLLNAGRMYLNLESLKGKVFVTSGLGGMSGAQAKAAVISGCIGVVAEVDETALRKRHEQGWVLERAESIDQCLNLVKAARSEGRSTSIALLGNVVDLWERLAEEPELLVDLGSDQTSCHNPFQGGYYPAGLTVEESRVMMIAEPAKFEMHVRESLRRQISAINKLADRGMRFWDYGNSFLLECARSGAEVVKEDGSGFRYPSYVEDIMGNIFSLGFGPFRWVCSSGLAKDLEETDTIAKEVIEKLSMSATEKSAQQYRDNHRWISQASEHNMVVGSQARILYSDARGRIGIAQAFNDAVASGRISAPVIISRDHHDVSGTDSPYRETSNITDGSKFCADMAVHCFVGNSFRGATWTSLHNGGGTGWGEAINGGFGMVLDGSADSSRRLQSMLFWDVCNGVARRAWGRNENALVAIQEAMGDNGSLSVTIPSMVDPSLLKDI